MADYDLRNMVQQDEIEIKISGLPRSLKFSTRIVFSEDSHIRYGLLEEYGKRILNKKLVANWSIVGAAEIKADAKRFLEGNL